MGTGVRGTRTLTVEGFTKIDDLVSLGHFLRDDESTIGVPSYLSVRRNMTENKFWGHGSKDEIKVPFLGEQTLFRINSIPRITKNAFERA